MQTPTVQSVDIEQELIKAVVRVVRHKEFYGHVVQQFEKIFVSNPNEYNVPTAAVMKFPSSRFIKLCMNRDYFREVYAHFIGDVSSPIEIKKCLKKARNVAAGAMEHEILHVVLGHLEMSFPDEDRGGVAVDCVVNQLIPDDRKMPNWISIDRYGLPFGRTSKWYYNNLKDNKKYQEDVKNGFLKKYLSSHKSWKDMKDPRVQQAIKDMIQKAIENTTAKGWGSVPGQVKDSIAKYLKVKPPQIPWQRVFRDFCASGIDTIITYTKSRISRRFGTRPGTRKEDILHVAVIVDTSGSIGKDQLESFFNEVRWIWRNGSTVTIIEADAKVQRIYSFRGKFEGDVHGGGGTNLTPAIKELDCGKYDVGVYFTDFQAPQVTYRCRIPVLWVLNNAPQDRDYWPAKWGKHVKIKV